MPAGLRWNLPVTIPWDDVYTDLYNFLVGESILIWLVVWLPFLAFSHIYWVANHPNWRAHIFQRGGPSTNQLWFSSLLGMESFMLFDAYRTPWVNPTFPAFPVVMSAGGATCNSCPGRIGGDGFLAFPPGNPPRLESKMKISRVGLGAFLEQILRILKIFLALQHATEHTRFERMFPFTMGWNSHMILHSCGWFTCRPSLRVDSGPWIFGICDGLWSMPAGVTQMVRMQMSFPNSQKSKFPKWRFPKIEVPLNHPF